MQISRTRAPWHSSAILTPALTSFYSPFRLLRRKTSSRLYVEFLFADHTGSDGASRGRSQPDIRLTALRFSPRWTQTQLRESSMGNECSLRFVQSCGRSHSYELLSKRSRCPLRVEECSQPVHHLARPQPTSRAKASGRN